MQPSGINTLFDVSQDLLHGDCHACLLNQGCVAYLGALYEEVVCLFACGRPTSTMPCRENTKRRPNFAFVSVGLEAKEVTWLKLHSGAIRSHAAYWGGSAKHQRKHATRIASPDTDQDSTSRSDTEPNFGYNVDRTDQMPIHLPDPFTYIQHDDMQHFPTVPSKVRETGLSFIGGLATFRFFGERFVRNFFTLDHEDCSSQ
jgi:hypothetical protein